MSGFTRPDREQVNSEPFVRLALVSWLEVCDLSELLVDPSGCPCVNALLVISIAATSVIISLAEGVREAGLPMSEASLLLLLSSLSSSSKNMRGKSLKEGLREPESLARIVLIPWLEV